MSSEKLREYRMSMVNTQLKKRGIKDKHILNAMKTIPRHKFVSTPLQMLSYLDRPLPIGKGQTISQPYIIAFMTELLNVKSHHTVLEIGTGCGYQTAVLSVLVRNIISLEIHKSLALKTEKRLNRLGYNNIDIYNTDGKNGWEPEAPYDRIIATACPSTLPARLVEQLANSGIMVIPIGKEKETQMLMVVSKNISGEVSMEPKLPVRFVPMV
jgi:protein-L-isoaspartate(D-aspartate) O-methyltransferase